MSFWNTLFKKRAEDWTYGEFTDAQVPEEPKAKKELEPDQWYITVRLRSLRIVNVRQLTKKFYGMVNSSVTLAHTGGKDATFQTVTIPEGLKNVDPTHLDRVITTNIPLAKNVPYRGGDLFVEMGLFSVEAGDLAGPYLDLLSDIADKAGVGILKTASTLLDPIKKGVDAIIGSNDGSILEIGISTNYTVARTGWFFIMRAPASEGLAGNVEVTPNDYKLVKSSDKSAVKEYPYLVFSISASKEHPEWYKLPNLAESYQNLRDAIRNGNYEQAKEMFIVFKRMALTSDDLLFDDAVRLTKQVESKMQEVMQGTLVAGKELGFPDLEQYQIFDAQ